MTETWPRPPREETFKTRMNPPTVIDRLSPGLLEELRKLNEAATPAPWAWRENEANAFGKKPNSRVVFALAGFSDNDEPSCHYFQRRVLQLRWSDVGKRVREPVNVSPLDPDKRLIVAMRNALPALLATIDAQRQRIQELEARITYLPENTNAKY